MISLVYSVLLHFDENKDNTVYSKLKKWIKKQPTNMQFKVQKGETIWSDPLISCVCPTSGSAFEWDNRIRRVIDEFGGTIVQEEGEDDEW